MKKAKLFFLFIFIGMFLLGSFPAVTSACSCAELPSAESELERSKAVFSGKVLDIKDRNVNGYMTKSVIFEVTNTWKGVEESQVIITTGEGGGDCGYPFIEGQEYLVYAIESDMYGGKSLVTIICDRTNKLSTLQNDLEVLGEGEPPTKKVDLSSTQNQTEFYIWIAGFLAIVVVLTIFLLNKQAKTDK